MPGTLTTTDQPSRAVLIELLRDQLALLADGEGSICKVAAEKGVFCRGFHRYSDEELKRRYDWIDRKQPGGPRARLEEVADRWQLARQDVTGQRTACDVQQLEGDACRGWDDFSLEDLARFHRELSSRCISNLATAEPIIS
jgi:hypothetical protein